MVPVQWKTIRTIQKWHPMKQCFHSAFTCKLTNTCWSDFVAFYKFFVHTEASFSFCLLMNVFSNNVCTVSLAQNFAWIFLYSNCKVLIHFFFYIGTNFCLLSCKYNIPETIVYFLYLFFYKYSFPLLYKL